VVTEEHGSEMRYFMLETIRQYAREKLFDAKEAAAARDRHFLYYDHLAEDIWNVFRAENVLSWRSQGDDEIENLRAAVEWAMDQYPEQAIRLAANFCLATGWMGNRAQDGLTLCRATVERVRSLPPVEGQANLERQKKICRALFALGFVGMGSGNMPLVIRDLQDGIATARIAGDKRMLGYNLEMFFTASQFLNTPGAEEAAREGYGIFTEELNDNWGKSMSYHNMARIAAIHGDAVARDMYFNMFKDVIQDTPVSIQAGLFYLGTGMNERMLGHYDTAKKYFEEGLAVFKNIRNLNFEVIMTSELGHVARQTGNLTQAKKIYKTTISELQNLGNRGAIANQLECFAFIAIQEDEPQRAASLLGAAEALRERAQSPMTDFEQVEYIAFVHQLHAMLAEDELNNLWTEGRSMTTEQAIHFTLERE
jgi:hypothetical protein